MMARSVSPLVPEFPWCPVSPVWPVARLCAQLCPSPHFAKLPAGPSLVRARQGSPAELCSFLSGRACKHDRPAHTALRLADTASQSQSSAPSDHIQQHCQHQQQCPRPRNNSSCGNKISAQIRLDVSRGPSRDEATVLWVFIFCALNIFAYNKYFPERATMISRLAARSCVSGYTDWVFIEMWSMTNPFSSILATSPEPGLFRPLKWCPSLPGKSPGN